MDERAEMGGRVYDLEDEVEKLKGALKMMGRMSAVVARWKFERKENEQFDEILHPLSQLSLRI